MQTWGERKKNNTTAVLDRSEHKIKFSNANYKQHFSTTNKIPAV